jgi:hypothetical protein
MYNYTLKITPSDDEFVLIVKRNGETIQSDYFYSMVEMFQSIESHIFHYEPSSIDIHPSCMSEILGHLV